MITKEDQALFDKLHCDNVIDLALLVPTSFDDTTLYTQITFGRKQALLVQVRGFQTTAKTLRINLFCKNLNHALQAIIFNAKPYHYATFKDKEELLIFAEVSQTQWGLQVTNPVKISKAGEVVAKYPTSIRSDSHARLVRTYITQENLEAEGLPPKIVDGLLEPFHLPKEYITSYNQQGPSYHSKQALKFAEVYSYMRKLAKKRDTFEAIPCQLQEVEAFKTRLPFTLTDDQQRAIEDIQHDLQKTTAAKRMVIGDVGAGKSMVIFATAFMNKKGKTILLSPTTLLAKQLYDEACTILYDFKIAFVTNKSKKESLEGYDFIVGTHALLYRQLPKASVVLIDEQHRFGTKQRNMLSKYLEQGNKRPHLFQFSATPIPRTQAMVDSALLDVSLIQQTPFTKDITTTTITKSDFPNLIEHIKQEIALEHQVLIIYPLVEESENFDYQSIEEARGFWEKKFDNVYVTHGKDKEKEEVLLAFREKGDILLATTVVEVGISLPKLSTIVIVGAERLGFATLHQLRGRVSRTGLKGYCFLYSNFPKVNRLIEFSNVSSGFEIAALDLKYRQSGDLLGGKRQSGAKYRWFDEAEDEPIAKEVQAYLQKVGNP